MHVHSFIAESAADAVAQIRAQLGPNAMVLNVRPLAPDGLSRLWKKRRIEVLACLPESVLPNAQSEEDLLPLLRQPLPPDPEAAPGVTDSSPASGSSPSPSRSEPLGVAQSAALDLPGRAGSWRVGGFLETSGLMPLYAARVVEELRAVHGDPAPAAFGRELELAAQWLRQFWHRTAPSAWRDTGTHVLVGAAGVGKTVSLCKWLARTVLIEGRRAAVWRLDGRTANTAEMLSMYGEILGVPVERHRPPRDEANGQDLLLVDLPGVNPADSAAIDQLLAQIKQLPDPQVHLVLNAAYELDLLQAQVRAFSVLPVTDLIFTHLDEETRWGKLWNFIIGTNFSIRFLSAGQNIPGDWAEAAPEAILSRQFPRK
jgi:flagellar biosynthesis protein FlhF